MHVLPDVSMSQACLFQAEHLNKSRLHPSPQDKAVVFTLCLPTQRAWYVIRSNCAVYRLTSLVSRGNSLIDSVKRLSGLCLGLWRTLPACFIMWRSTQGKLSTRCQ